MSFSSDFIFVTQIESSIDVAVDTEWLMKFPSGAGGDQNRARGVNNGLTYIMFSLEAQL